MQNRSRDYYRKMRAKHIRRKKNIVRHWKWWSDNDYNYYPHDGMYSKNKIHCSCPICSPKTRNKGRRDRKNYARSLNYKHSELRRQIAMDEEMLEYAGTVGHTGSKRKNDW